MKDPNEEQEEKQAAGIVPEEQLKGSDADTDRELTTERPEVEQRTDVDKDESTDETER